MKKTSLQKLSEILKTFIKASKSKDWIEPDDERYQKILRKYEKELSKVWNRERNDYAKRIKKKDLDIDETIEDYPDQELDHSDYIDDALAILALAFGAGVLVGFEEIQNRGITVEIPSNPWQYFEEAGEIHDYSHAALSKEQQDFNDAFEQYNKIENGKQQLKDWFDKNKYRLTDLMLGGVVWYGINYGFAKAAIVAQDETFLYWLTEKDSKVCSNCKLLESNNPYSKDNPLTTLPGGGKTICGSRCRCIIDTKERE
jgi:hypothetical protein